MNLTELKEEFRHLFADGTLFVNNYTIVGYDEDGAEFVVGDTFRIREAAEWLRAHPDPSAWTRTARQA